VNDDADWASYLRSIIGLRRNATDVGRTFVVASMSRAIKTLLAYRTLDIACYVLKLAPERNHPLSLAKPNQDNAESSVPCLRPSSVHQLREPLDVGNWAQEILDVEQLLEVHWAQPSVAASSSTLALSNTLGPSNNTKERIIQSVANNIKLSNSGRRSEKVHRFLASFHEVSAVMGYIISEVRPCPSKLSCLLTS
jgi:hypothetical protein